MALKYTKSTTETHDLDAAGASVRFQAVTVVTNPDAEPVDQVKVIRLRIHAKRGGLQDSYAAAAIYTPAERAQLRQLLRKALVHQAIDHGFSKV